MSFLVPDRVIKRHGLTIKEKFIPRDARISKPTPGFDIGDYFRSQERLDGPTSLTIHNTGDVVPATGTTRSEQYARATYPNGNMGEVRVHYWVCPEEVWQQLPDTDVAYHAGSRAGNKTSLSMEIIGSSAKATENGALLAALILSDRGWGVDRLRTHNYWFGKPDYIVNDGYKNCPLYIMSGIGWKAFKSKVQGYLDMIAMKPDPAPAPAPKPQPTNRIFRVQVGAYRIKENAEAMRDRLIKLRYDPWMYTDGELWRVQVGAYKVEENAESLATRLKQQGFDVWIVEVGLPHPPEMQKPVALEIKEGDKVKVKDGAKTWIGGGLADFVYKTTYDVLERNGDRVVIGLGDAVTAAVRAESLIKV